MITWLRNVVSRDLGLKVFALALAVLIWTTVHAILEGSTESPALSLVALKTFRDLPVWVVAPAADVRAFRVLPARVDVTVRGEQEILNQLRPGELRVTVVLTDLAMARDLRQRVEVATPPGVTLVRVTPDEVTVIVPPD